MKKPFFAAVVGVVGLAGPVHAEPTVNDILKDPRSGFARLYIDGLGSGLSWANVAAKMKGKPVYCPPGKVAITADQYIDILRRYIADHPHMTNDFVGGPMLFALEDAFPCP